MIQPVNAFSPKVLFRGGTVSSKETNRQKTLRGFAQIDITCISFMIAAIITAIARIKTSSWKHASYFGIGAAIISMLFVGPGIMHKYGIGATKQTDKDVFVKDIDISKKLINNSGELTTTAKNTTKAAIRVIPKA